MMLVVNGEKREFGQAPTVDELLALENEQPRHVLVAINGVFVPSSEFSATRPVDGDQVEIINPIFGG